MSNPTAERGNKRRHGNARFAAPMSRRQSKELWEQIRAAWSYINQRDSIDKYDAASVELIKDRIKQSAKARGIEISDLAL